MGNVGKIFFERRRKMEGTKMLKVMVLELVLAISGAGTIEASFMDNFENPGSVTYTGSDSYGGGGSFTISGGKLNITTGADNTFSVMTSDTVEFAVGDTLSLDVPPVLPDGGPFMMCSTTAAQPDGTSTFGFRFRRDGYARIHLYPGGILADTLDPDPSKPATLLVKRTSDTGFNYSMVIEGTEATLGSFTLSALSGTTQLHIGAQAYDLSGDPYAFDNLQVHNCEDYFRDHFDDYDPNAYTGSNSYGSGGSFTISSGQLNITTGINNTFSVMTTDCKAFCVGVTLSLEVPGYSGSGDIFMMCSTTDGQPDGTSTFGFRFRRDGGTYARMQLYPGGIVADTLDPDPTEPATVCVERTSDTDFDYSIIINGTKTQLGSFTLSQLAGIINLHVGAQAYALSNKTFAFDNLRILSCGDWGYHQMDFNQDCFVNMLDFSAFCEGWLECTMPGEPGCNNNTETESFSVVIFPDTQMWSQDTPGIFDAASNWVVANKDDENIKFVLHVGDIVNADEQAYQWDNADAAMSILDGNVPYCFGVGNHDMTKGDPAYVPDPNRDTTNFNNTFPYTRYEGESWYGGRMLNDAPYVPADNYDNTYHFFSAKGMEFMIVCLSVAPTDNHLAWADGIVSGYPEKRVIIVTHSYMDGSTRLTSDMYSPPGGNSGQDIWDEFIKLHENIFFVACGHLSNGRLTDTGDNGNTVHQTVNNNGLLRILRFVPDDNMIYVTSYNPNGGGYITDPGNQYDLPYNMN
jgi:hypothetical protein